jgi:hypothetical protein
MINQNDLAVRITEMEGKKVEVNIAQVKEVQKCLLLELAMYPNKDVTQLLDRVASRCHVERPEESIKRGPEMPPVKKSDRLAI